MQRQRHRSFRDLLGHEEIAFAVAEIEVVALQMQGL